MKEGVARVSFELKSGYTDRGREISGAQKGTWRFDIARGREVSLEAEGSMQIDRLEAGDGSFRMTRTLPYR